MTRLGLEGWQKYLPDEYSKVRESYEEYERKKVEIEEEFYRPVNELVFEPMGKLAESATASIKVFFSWVMVVLVGIAVLVLLDK